MRFCASKIYASIIFSICSIIGLNLPSLFRILSIISLATMTLGSSVAEDRIWANTWYKTWYGWSEAIFMTRSVMFCMYDSSTPSTPNLETIWWVSSSQLWVRTVSITFRISLFKIGATSSLYSRLLSELPPQLFIHSSKNRKTALRT